MMFASLKFFDIFKDVILKIYEIIESIYNYVFHEKLHNYNIIIKDIMLRCFLKTIVMLLRLIN
jgi:hypothetical protein